MLVAPLPPDQRDAAVALWHEVGLTRPWNDSATDLRRALAGPSSTVLAALDGDTLLGTAMVGHDGHRGWIYYVAVSPAHQGRGLGRDLVAACERWLEGRAPKVQLMVRTDNDAVVSFYQRLGYERSDVHVLSRRLEG